MLIDKEIEIYLNNRYKQYYKDNGYNTDGVKKLIIKIEDLPKVSHYNVKVKCDKCGNEKEIKYYNYIINFEKKGKYICNNCKSETISDSNLLKYGVKSTLQLDSVKEKCKNTMIEKYGVDHYSKTDEFKNLSVEKYGVKSTLELNYVKEKSKKTMNERYGVDYYSKCDNFKEQINNTCTEKYGVDHYSKTEEFKEIIRNSVLQKNILKNEINIIDYQKNFFKVKCEKNHDYLIDRCTLKNRILYKTEICTICNPIGSFSNSGYETLFQDFIKNNYTQEIKYNLRNLISPQEIDVYLPDLKLAFEFNGLYWHSEINKEKDYHLNKTENCENQGIELLHIWDDDWLYKNDIIKSMIFKKLGKNENKIDSTDCKIKEIDNNNLIRYFLNNNHIQGFVGSKIKIGLFHNDELVSLMTFNKKNKEKYKLLRFCDKVNTNIKNSEELLFHYFIDKYEPTEIVANDDRSFSQSKLYEKLGFKLQEKTEPNFYYIIDGIRHNKYNFRKDKLIKEGYDKNKTEHEIMLERKILRIYDSGNLKFIYTKK
jgi:very-short-patch-repair endonuclease